MPWIRFGVRTIYRQRARPADRQTVWTCGRCWSTWSLKSKNTILERDPSGHPQGAVRRPHRPRRPLRRLRRGGSAALLRRRRLQGALQPRGPGGHHRALPGSRLHLFFIRPWRSEVPPSKAKLGPMVEISGCQLVNGSWWRKRVETGLSTLRWSDAKLLGLRTFCKALPAAESKWSDGVGQLRH